ncbi:MAG: peptidylprolyl isomerase [Terriglobales bacterium]
MARCGVMCLLLLSVAWAQTPNTTRSALAHGQESAAIPAPVQDSGFHADKVPLNDPVITITGLCDHPSTRKSNANCETVITRAEFEAVVDVVKPHAPQPVRKMLAKSYVQALVEGNKAVEMGLDKRPDFADRMEVNRLLVSQETLDEALNQRAWDKVSDKQIEHYYRNNPDQFVQVDAERIFVPWFEPDEDPNQKLTGLEKRNRDLAWQRSLRGEADKLHARALAGEDFLELQKEAYKFTGVSSDIDRTNIALPRTRRLMLDSVMMPLMDLKPGQISAVLVEDNGYDIFKATGRRIMPFDAHVIKEIHGKLRDEIVAKEKTALARLEATSTTYNEDYFGPPLPPPPAKPSYDVMPVEKP